MWAFKDQVRKDYATFLNATEFAQTAEINGENMMCLIDQDYINSMSNLQVDYFDGGYKQRLTVYVRYADLGYLPEAGSAFDVDRTRYEVVSASVAQGIVSINLGVNEG